MLTGVAFGAIVGAALLFGRHRPHAAASLEAPLPAPQTWTRLSSADPEDASSISAEFRSAVLVSPQGAAGSGQGRTIALRFQVSPSDCRALEARVGGSCGEGGAPLALPEKVAVQSLDEPLQGFLKLEDGGAVALSQTSAEGESQPSEWTLAEGAAKATLAFECNPGDRLLLADGRSAPATCARYGASYTLEVNMPRASSPRLHLYGVHSFEAHFRAAAAEARVEEGQLILAGSAQTVSSSEPEPISIRAEAPHRVRVAISDLRSGATHLSVHTNLASTAEGAGYELPTWLESNARVSWLAIGLFAGSFLTAGFQYLVKRRRR